MKKIGEVCSFFGGRATLGLLKRCFGVSGLKLRGALGYLRGFNLVDNQIEGVYHRFQGQKCSRSAHLELIWEIPVKTIHIPGHTQGSIAVHVNIAGKRVLFGQDIHGPYEVAWGGDASQAVISLQRLIDIKADILCEGHFDIYQPASEVRKYIEGYLYQLQRRITGEQ